MKKFLLFVIALLSIESVAYGDNENDLSIAPVALSKSKSALMVNIVSGLKYSVLGVKFTIELPEGVEFVKNGEDPSYIMGSTFSGTTSFNFSSDRKLTAGIMQSQGILGSKGLVFAFQIQPQEGYSFASPDLKGDLSDMQITVLDDPTNDSSPTTLIKPTAKKFDITVTDCDVVLDENSPFDLEESNGEVDILVKRSLTGGHWSTICLPFDLEWSDFKTIFGENTVLAEFSDYKSEDEYETMSINFNSIKTDGTDNDNPCFSSNWPYLIKPSNDVTNFEVKAEVSPDDVLAEYDNGKKGKQRVVFGSFIGSYTADLVIPENDLFISNNKFYYSIGTTRMKAFRGYFEFKDKLKTPALSRAFVDGKAIEGFDDSTTGISNRYITQSGKVYSLTGRFVGEKANMKSLPKGVYVVDGVKVINK